MQIDLNNVWPEGADGKRGPLPKQAEFMRLALQPRTPKYIAYVGGVGSGKSRVGCATMLTLAVLYPGEYMICRQFMPELKMTTYVIFKAICPPELIIDENKTEGTLTLRSSGGTSKIYFRGLDDPEKYRSAELNAFLIDESNQVSEEAFMQLQSRLRGPHVRKGFLVSNPCGHDWTWRWFFDKSHIKDPEVKKLFHLIRAPSTENKHLPDDYLTTALASWSTERIQREIEGSFDAFEGSVYSEFKRELHVIKPFKIPSDWPRYIGMDHGLRNPAAWIWGAVGPDGEIYFYREMYEKELLIKELCSRGLRLNNGEKILDAVIDPSTRARRATNGESDYDEYVRCLPKTFPIRPANNDVTLGIDRVKAYMQINPAIKKPLLYVFDTCTNLLEEISQYRYPELRASQEGRKAEHEKPIKVNDHALDALRYLCMLLPDPYKSTISPEKQFNYNSSERALLKEIDAWKNKKKSGDIWQDS